MIEELIYKQLTNNSNISDVLTSYNNSPAVFMAQAPQDNDEKWATSQYPRAVFSVNAQYSPDRKSSGTLTIDVLCIENQSIAPEDITGLFVNSLNGVFFTSDDGDVKSALWKRTDPFEVHSGNNNPRVIGATMEFDLLSFPCRETINPDPVMGLSAFIKSQYSMILIGRDEIPSIFKPSKEQPAIYIRPLSNTAAQKNSHAVAWMNSKIACHVFAGDYQQQEMLLRSIVNCLSVYGEFRLLDNSPYLINQLALDSTANPLTSGQLTINGTFGVLRPIEYEDPMKNIMVGRR